MLAAALAASRRAVALAPNSGYARASLAIRYRNALDMRRALAESEQALRLSPADARVVSDVGLVVRNADPDRAVILTRLALSLDPLNPLYLQNYGAALLAAQRLAQAADAARQAMALSNNQQGGNTLVAALFIMGDHAQARANLRHVGLKSVRLTLEAAIEARAGNRAASDAALAAARWIDDGSMHSRLAIIHAQRGETGLALDALEASLRSRETLIHQIAVSGLFDPIRREPRFKAVRDAVIPPDLFVPPKRA